MISFVEVINACIFLQHLCSINLVKNSLKTLNTQLVSFFNEISKEYASLQTNKTLKLSSGEKFDNMWDEFSKNLKKSL